MNVASQRLRLALVTDIHHGVPVKTKRSDMAMPLLHLISHTTDVGYFSKHAAQLFSLLFVAAFFSRIGFGMLAGSTLAGKILFRDCDLIMHRVTEPTPTTLETRWTLQFRFQLLPWAPLAEFTGVSKYTLDGDARVVRQDDFWDSVNLSDGEYAARPPGDAGAGAPPPCTEATVTLPA